MVEKIKNLNFFVRRLMGILYMVNIYGSIQRRGKKILQQIICGLEVKKKIIKEFHESLQAWHRGIWAIFSKLKEKYQWKGMSKDEAEFIGSYENFQLQTNIRHQDRLYPTYPFILHYKLVVDLVLISIRFKLMKYLVLA